MHESLKVYLKDRFVGWLSHESTGDVFSFKYDDAYLADPSDGALSFGRLDDMAKRIVPAAFRLADACNARYPSRVYSRILSVIKSHIARVGS